MIQDLLPNIKDVSQRAGLIKEIAPKIEEEMAVLQENLNKSKKHK
jgi:hypothetical protein